MLARRLAVEAHKQGKAALVLPVRELAELWSPGTDALDAFLAQRDDRALATAVASRRVVRRAAGQSWSPPAA